MKYPGFVGASVPSRSKTINNERTVNLYVEGSDGTPKANPSLLIRPATRSWTYCAPGPIRGFFAQDNRMFAVSGGWFYEIFQSRNVTIRGQVTLDGKPATISSNGPGGNQLGITSGGDIYMFDLVTNTLTAVADVDRPDPCIQMRFSDGYFIGLKGQSAQFQLSALEDGTDWNGLDVAQASESSDLKLAIEISHRELWFFGSKYTEVWYNSGLASFPYQPVSGVFIEHGIAAPWSVVRLDNTLYWLGQDEAGRGIVWRANGYTPERVSTNALEHVMQQWPRLDDAQAFAFQMDGHAWYALYSPHNDTTWLYDIGAQSWVEWAHWDEQMMRFVPWVANSHASCWGKTFVGDRQSGMIYELDLTQYQDRIAWLT